MASWEENILRTYFYWAFHPRLTASLEFQYEELDRGVIQSIFTIRSRLIAFLSGSIFSTPSGFFAKVRPTLIHQEGHFFSLLSGVSVPNKILSSYFDASAGWLLPKRWGIVSLEARNLFDQSFDLKIPILQIRQYLPGEIFF